MKKIISIALVLALAVLGFAACSPKDVPPAESDLPVEPDTTGVDPEGMSMTEERLNNLTENEYDGISVTVEDLGTDDIASGSIVPVKITVKNTGDKSVVYTLGSGMFKTPQALWMDIPKLQPVLPEDYVGPATMDYVVKELAPGETISHTMYVMAVDPHPEFDNYTYDYYSSESSYIGSRDYTDLFERYPELTLAPEGSYNASVYFTYYLKDNVNAVGNPTGYAKADFVINLTPRPNVEPVA